MSQSIKFSHIHIYLIGSLVLINLCNGIYLSSSDHRLCGARLSDILIDLCKGQLNSITSKNKKSDVNDEYLNDDNMTADDSTESGGGGGGNTVSGGNYSPNLIDEEKFLSKLSKNDVIYTRVRRSWLRVADECCKKPCSVATLRAYCNF